MSHETFTAENGQAHVDVDGHRADVLIDRPEKRNAMNRPVVAALTEAFDWVAERDEVRAVTLLGEGPVFCAGMDLEMMRDSDATSHEEIGGDLRALFERLDALRKPVVAGIKRAGVAGGFELTLPADFRILGEDAKYGVVEVKLGVFPSGGSTQRLPRLVGLARAKELVLTGEYVDPEEADRMGLVTEVVPDDAVDERAREFADGLTENAPLGMERALRAFGHAFEVPLDAGLDVEASLSAPLYDTHDHHEGFSARIEGRDPEFEGR
ncbi:enoyl-CoA hydratase/isomerase family protein [Halomarina oriensis]|uniref:Enoyl-CoA hydratase/isomerase family protein n=1 Tax=Halomarina oriensis TaxID=671145 RepID=A0A6B0GH92_9EURY|nr:enoyl-CoA hydratase/isomerase family protein [Halomarina oriensis]MWG34242.1 enoyl-CoA hydratase/isomerase family protein [Halomarina oriensis]